MKSPFYDIMLILINIYGKVKTLIRCIRENFKIEIFLKVLDLKFSAGQHMVLCMAEVVNYGMGMDYVPNHGKLMSFV
jgi:cobalamin biosynthesis Co2+ chelatase CbiK